MYAITAFINLRPKTTISLHIFFFQYVLASVLYILYNCDEKLFTEGGTYYWGAIDMSLFGQHLRALIEANKVNVYALAKQAGLERTAIHKIMSGGRIPSEEYAQKLATSLPLSPEERRRFLESYKISSIGAHKYKQRMQVKELIEFIAQIEKGYTVYSKGAAFAPVGNDNTVATGSFAVNNLVKSVLIDIFSTPETKPSIDFIIPDGYQYFHNELLAFYVQNPTICIRHVITFSKKMDFANDSNANIGLLNNILHLVFVFGTEYHPYYHYRASAVPELTQAMPYFILTSSRKLVLISRDLNKAALICDKDIVDMYSEIFEDMLALSNPLISTYNNIHEVLNYYMSITHNDKDEPVHVINPEPNIEPILTKEMITNIVKQGIPSKEDLIELIWKNYSLWRENKNPYINICATEGIYNLLNTGRIHYAPNDLLEPIPKDMMVDIMRGLQQKIKNEKVKLLFTDPSKIKLPQKTFIDVTKNGLIIFTSKGEANNPTDFMCIYLHEESINEAFLDFVENIEQSGIVYSLEESIKVLDCIINDM